MKEEFYDYLRNLFWLNVQYGIQKNFSVYKSAYYTEDLNIWEYENTVRFGDSDDYVREYIDAFRNGEKDSVDTYLPDIKYQTEDEKEIRKIINALKINNYEEKITELMEVINREKALILVDNKGYVKYN